MRDFPIFDTENGVGSLVLKEIPYRKAAYIRIASASEPELFLKECVDFCRMVGAEQIYATGHAVCTQYPLYTAVWKMCAPENAFSDPGLSLFPVTEKTAQQWQQIYNEKMRRVPCGAYMTQKDMEQMIRQGGGYFLHRDGQLIGLGRHTGGNLDAVISMQKGAGEQVVRALAQCAAHQRITLEVASENHKAVALYEKMGFIKTQELAVWYQVNAVK